MHRITQNNLEALCEAINRAAGTPLTNYTKHPDGTIAPNAHNYHLDGAYGGWGLCQMCEEGTGVRDIIGGHMPKRELYDRMQAFLAGLRAAKD